MRSEITAKIEKPEVTDLSQRSEVMTVAPTEVATTLTERSQVPALMQNPEVTVIMPQPEVTALTQNQNEAQEDEGRDKGPAESREHQEFTTRPECSPLHRLPRELAARGGGSPETRNCPQQREPEEGRNSPMSPPLRAQHSPSLHLTDHKPHLPLLSDLPPISRPPYTAAPSLLMTSFSHAAAHAHPNPFLQGLHNHMNPHVTPQHRPAFPQAFDL